MFSSAFVLVALCASAMATPFVTSPVATSSFVAGQDNTISWIDSADAPSLKEFGPSRISLYVGNAQQQTSLQTIQEVDLSSTNSIPFKPDPSVGENSKEYFIRIESLSLKDAKSPQYPALAFSSKFEIKGMTGTFTADVKKQIEGQTTAPLASPPSTAAPSGSAAPSGKAAASGGQSLAASASKSAAPTSSASADNGSFRSTVSGTVVLGSLLVAAFALF